MLHLPIRYTYGTHYVKGCIDLTRINFNLDMDKLLHAQ